MLNPCFAMKESLLSTIFMEFVLMNNLISKLKIWLRATPIEDYFIPTVLLVLVFSTDNRLILITKQLAVVLTVAWFREEDHRYLLLWEKFRQLFSFLFA